ncbi:dioxygenase [Planktotalea sp.]|uniref:dioxygenase family protein n=1 Tax=Planktotalea sp. TaxID=2029877 RepID=UPI0025F6C781|nr:dioxygenase [Planktotalea sp.]
MRNVTKENITDAFAGYISKDTDPRTAEVMNSLAKHLHAFVRETQLTHAEWEKGIEMLEWAGEISDKERHEMVLLSDLLGISSLVDLINMVPGGSSSSVLGPFHIAGAPAIPFGHDMKRHYEGPILLSKGVIQNMKGEPIEGAQIDIWQTAPNGLYSSQDPEQGTYSFHGIQTVGSDGRYGFTTVKPVSYEVPTDGPAGALLSATGRQAWRPSHLHFIVKAKGYRTLVSEVFAGDDPYLDEDAVFGVREDLVMHYEDMPAGSFPDGFDLSGKVDGPYMQVDFDLTLVAE